MAMIDDLNLRLIRCLQDDPRASYSTIARLVGVSETTVKRRIDALMESNVISTAVFPNPRRLGFQAQASIGLKTELAQMEAVALALRDLPEVAFVALTLGRYDVMTYVVLPTMDDLVRFIAERIAKIPGVRESETILTPRVYKAFANWRVPIDCFVANGRVTEEDANDLADVF